MNDISPLTDAVASTNDDPRDRRSGSPAPLVLSLLSISKSTRAFLALLLAGIELHPGQDQLINQLQPGEPVSVSVLADLLAVRPSTVSKMLDRLIDRQLVSRTVSSRDARRTMVTLTEKGEKMKPEIRRIWTRLENELRMAVSDEESEKLILSLAQVDSVLAARLRRLR